MLGFPVVHYLLKFAQLTSVELVMPFNHLFSFTPFSSCPQSNELAVCITWLKYWRFSTRTSSEYSGLISVNIDWFDLFAVQGTLKNLLQH